MTSDEEFVRWVAARAPSLRRTAYLLCGDWHVAEDLTQEALARLYRSWSRLARRDHLEAYARKVLLRLYLDRQRLRSTGETPFADPPDSTTPPPGSVDDPDSRLDLVAALAALTPRHRSVLVLRFWDDLAVSTVADLMGVPVGTVKSTTARALDALRAELAQRGVLIDVRGDD